MIMSMVFSGGLCKCGYHHQWKFEQPLNGRHDLQQNAIFQNNAQWNSKYTVTAAELFKVQHFNGATTFKRMTHLGE